MQRIIENFPEFKKGERNTSKHFNILEELRKIVDGRNLYDLSEVEQDLVSGKENKVSHFRLVEEKINNQQISKVEKLRLAMLFALRYENDEKVFQVKEALKKQGLADNQVKIVDCVIEYAGKAIRGGDLFQNKDFIAKGKQFFSSMFKDVQNVLLQHKPMLYNVIDSALKSKLPLAEFPIMGGMPYDSKSAVIPASNVIAFVVGGTTYEEAKEVALSFNSGADLRVILGGNFIHNSKSFMADIS